jgi:hypothetical protein
MPRRGLIIEAEFRIIRKNPDLSDEFFPAWIIGTEPVLCHGNARRTDKLSNKETVGPLVVRAAAIASGSSAKLMLNLCESTRRFFAGAPRRTCHSTGKRQPYRV